VRATEIDNASATPRLEMGGQAVIEGVLMRSRTGYAVALRRDDGRIVVSQVPYAPLSRRWRLLKLPILRGATALVEMMAIGTRALRWSAEEFEKALLRADAKAAAGASGPPSEATVLPKSAGEAWRQAGFIGMITVSLAIVVFMVVIAPNLLAALLGKVPWLHDWALRRGTLGFAEENHPVLFNLVSGCFRALILVLYVWVISLNSDIRRVFQYHGAEHKAVLALEDGAEVTVAGAQKHDTLHPRCGTTFLAVVVLVSIIFFSLSAAALVAYVSGFPDWSFLARKGVTFLTHILLLPLVAGTAFELMKFCAKRPRNPVCALLLWPGFRFQRLTTRPPEDAQVEVAIVALLAALAIAPGERASREYVVRGLHDDESAPGFAPALQEVPG